MSKTLTGMWIAALLMTATVTVADAASATLTLQGNAYFTLRQERPGLADDQYFETSQFNLPAGATIDPVTEPVTVELSTPLCGVFSRLVIPAGLFESRAGGKIAFFDGVITDGITGKRVLTSIRVTSDRGGFFKLALDFKEADYTACLEGDADALITTRVIIGDDTLQTPPTCFERLSDGDLWWPAPYIPAC